MILRVVDDYFEWSWTALMNGFGNNTDHQNSYCVGMQTMYEMTKDHPLKLNYIRQNDNSMKNVIFDSARVQIISGTQYKLSISNFNATESNGSKDPISELNGLMFKRGTNGKTAMKQYTWIYLLTIPNLGKYVGGNMEIRLLTST